MRSPDSWTSPSPELLPSAVDQPAPAVHRMRYHIACVSDILNTTATTPARCLTTEDLVVELAELATIARLVGELLSQRRPRFADWLPVDAHLRQAQACAGDLHRGLNHASATFAFATLPVTA